jgi:recombinational DNA repair protein (RecF pathway)
MSVAVEADLLASSGWSADFVSCVRSMRSYAFACLFSSGALNL